jgi:hypothetical protein
MARVNRKLIPYLRNVSRWLWLLIFGGLLLFIVIALTVAVGAYPMRPKRTDSRGCDAYP